MKAHLKVFTLIRKSVFVFCALVAIVGCKEQQAPAGEVAPVPENSFQYERQIGIANIGYEATEGCLAVANALIEPGAKLILADQGARHVLSETSRISEATVVERLSEDCDNRHMLSTELSNSGPTYYRIRTTLWKGNGYVFVIVPPSGPVTINKDGNIEGDLDGDGMNEFFRMCLSNEGAHYQVWTGPPLTGRPRWHWYVYAGYDTDSNCTEKEYFGPQ